MRFAWIVLGSLVFAGSACTGTQSSAPELLRTATIKDIMDSMVDPSGDFVFESIAEIADERGITHKEPRTDEEWKEVRRHALVLLESPNLLTMEGRKVATLVKKQRIPR